MDDTILLIDDHGEVDPDGRDLHAGGAKADAGKPMVSLVVTQFSRALWEVSRVATYGAAKYTPGGWMTVRNGLMRYTDAQFRHELAWGWGEDVDPETGLYHLASAAWNALARLELALEAGGSLPRVGPPRFITLELPPDDNTDGV